jgi:predicted nucleic acid-binding protein
VHALRVAERKRRIDAAKLDTFVDALRRLPIVMDGETGGRAWHTILLLSRRFELSSYDAAYLELAERRRLPLATLDRALARAAVASGVEVLGVG